MKNELKDWQDHPYIEGLRCHKSGKRFTYNKKSYKPIKTIQKKKDGREIISWKLYFNKTSYSPYKLTLEAWLGESPKDKRYYCRVKDGDKDNIHYTNLFWTGNLSTKYRFTNADQVKSKLTDQQLLDTYRRYTREGATLSDLAEEYDCSDMTISRAIKRYERTFIIGN